MYTYMNILKWGKIISEYNSDFGMREDFLCTSNQD